METKQANNSKRWLLLAFGANFAAAFLALIPYMIRDGGILMIAADFNAEQLSYNMLCNTALKTGEALWNWRIDIGSDFVSSFSFYTLGSPFFWLSMLFPAKWFPYLVGWIYMLKYAVAGLTSFCYFRRCTGAKSALAASMLYAFSGYQSCNVVFYHFHDVVALFPLLLLGLDDLVQKGKKGRFLLAVALNALLNYYFFIGEVIFLILYYAVRYLLCERGGSPARTLKSIGSCLLEGALGVGLAGVLFVPSILSVLQNPRVSDKITLSGHLVFDGANYLQMLRALFFPAEDMFWMSAVMHDNWYSIAAYLPITGISLALAYFFRRKKDWLCILLALCAVLAASPFLNNIFVLLTSEPYRRWYYMPIFFLALATAKVLDAPAEYPWKWGIGVSLACMAAILLYIGLHRELILLPKWYWFISFVGVAGLVWLWIALRWREVGWIRHLLLPSIACCCVVTTMLTVHCYRSAYSKTVGMTTKQTYQDAILTADGLTDALPYRYFFWEHYTNRGMAGYLPERNSFLSTLSPSVFTFYRALGVGRPRNITPDGPEGTNELLSVRYYVRNENSWGSNWVASYSNGGEQIYVYQDSGALPIGFCYDTYLTQSEFQQLPSDSRALAMLKTLVVADGDVPAVSAVLRHYDEAQDGAFTAENRPADMEKRREACSSSFTYSTDSFESHIASPADRYAFFSVPYSSDWSSEVNGKAVAVLNINGLMAVPVSAGDNVIRFRYTPKELYAGAAVSAVCALLTAGYLLSGRRRKRHPAEASAADKRK